MKKILCGYAKLLDILDPKDYVIIEKDRQRISDKYVDLDGNKINEYKRKKVLKKGDVIIRGFYYIDFWDEEDITLFFKKFKYYDIYRNSNELTSKLKQCIKSKNSTLDFDIVRERIINTFSRNVKIKIR